MRENALQTSEALSLWRARNAISKPGTKRPYSHPIITRDIITRHCCSIGAKKEELGRSRPEDEGRAAGGGGSGGQQARRVRVPELRDVGRLLP
jgi:hypothetical protein